MACLLDSAKAILAAFLSDLLGRVLIPFNAIIIHTWLLVFMSNQDKFNLGLT